MLENFLSITRRRFACCIETHIASRRDGLAQLQASHWLQPRRNFDERVFSTCGAGSLRQSCCICLRRACPRSRRSAAASTRRPTADTVHAIAAEHGMVVAQEKLAAQDRRRRAAAGGNAVDAAVATGFALAVTYPRAGNIGGGGFMVIHSAERHEDVAIDYRETAPAATTRDIFLGPDGKPDTDKVARFRARHRRARHRRRTGAGAREIRLGQVHARGIPQARDRAGARRLCGRRRHRRHAAGMYRRMARWPNSAKMFSRARRHAAARGRSAGPDRSRGDAVGDCRTGATRILRRAGRRKAGEGGPRRRRHHDGGGSQILSGRDPQRRCAAAIAATTSSRCRCPRPAASCCWRR